MNNVKITIAKILSLFTVLLLSSNVVLSSVPARSLQTVLSFTEDEGKEQHISSAGANGASLIGFGFENDPFEDLELIADLPEDNIDFSVYVFSEEGHSGSFMYSHFNLRQKMPRWLWVRHIII